MYILSDGWFDVVDGLFLVHLPLCMEGLARSLYGKEKKP